MSNLDKYWTIRGNSEKAEVFTPPSLVKEMLDKIPEEIWKSSETTFLDPCFGSGTFIRYIIKKLREYGHNDENISKRIWGIDISKKWYNRVKHFKVGKYNINNIYCCDSLKTHILDNMKFDVIVGNPPYQGESKKGGFGSGNAIWHKFVESAYESLKKGGYLCFVHPIDWRTDTIKKKIKGVRDILWSNQMEYVKMATAPFPGVRVLVDWYILKKESKSKKTRVEFLDGEREIFLENPPLFSYGNEIVESIKNKVLKDSDNGLIRNQFFWIDKSKEGGKYKYAHGTKYTKDEWKYFSAPHKDQFTPKVIMSSVRKPRPIFDSGNLGIGGHVHYIPVKNKMEGDFLISVINSKLGTFLQKIFCTGFWDGDSSYWNNPFPISKIKIDDKKLNGDRDVFDYFNLTPEEVDYINQELSK